MTHSPRPASPPILLLDVMDTLVHDPFFVEVIAHLNLTLPELFAVKDKDAWLAFERNEISEEEYRRQFWKDRSVVDLDGVKRVMTEGYRFLDGIEALLSELKAANVPMYALSNYPHWWTLIEGKLGLSRFLEWRFVSCQTGVRKPDPRAYLGPAEILGVAPEQCIFVDDRPHNCDAAIATGMKAVHFQSAASLRNTLVAHWVLPTLLAE